MKIPKDYRIIEIRYMSYIFKNKMINKIINLYFKFENALWYRITIDDGRSIFEPVDEPKINDINCKNDFNYPIKEMKEVKIDMLGKLLKVDEYFWNGYEDESIGFIFYFDNDLVMSVIEDDEQISLDFNTDNNRLKNCSIKEKKILDIL